QDGEELLWNLDRNGNILGLTPVGRPEHLFEYENAVRLSSYKPASGLLSDELFNIDPDWDGKVLQGAGDFRLGEIRYGYDKDNRLETIAFADGRTLTYDYRPGTGSQRGLRLRKISYSRGDLKLSYRSDFAGLSSIGNPDATVSFEYDDPLLTSVSW